jgi:hypothetical protein
MNEFFLSGHINIVRNMTVERRYVYAYGIYMSAEDRTWAVTLMYDRREDSVRLGKVLL